VKNLVPCVTRGSVLKGTAIARHSRACLQSVPSISTRSYQAAGGSLDSSHILNNPFEKPKTQIEIMIRDMVGGLEVRQSRGLFAGQL
jgi:hypothetical protein